VFFLAPSCIFCFGRLLYFPQCVLSASLYDTVATKNLSLYNLPLAIYPMDLYQEQGFALVCEEYDMDTGIVELNKNIEYV